MSLSATFIDNNCFYEQYKRIYEGGAFIHFKCGFIVTDIRHLVLILRVFHLSVGINHFS